MSTRPGIPLFAPERQQEIATLAREAGRVEVADLAQRFGVTTETVRRDLRMLEDADILRRLHGGAVPVERLHVVPDLSERATAMARQKRQIAHAALHELPTNGSIAIDAGTTTARLADIIPDDLELTVVTNALPIAETLSRKPKLTVHLLGGRVRPPTLALVDDWTVRLLREVSVDVAFLGTYGVSAARGLTTPDTSEASVKRAMIEAARRVVVLADHTKLGTDHFARFADLDDVDLLVTDREGPAERRQELADAGLQIRLAGRERVAEHDGADA